MIILDRQNGLFTLQTRNSTYQIKIGTHGVLLHSYYGPRVDGEDLARLIRSADRGASVYPNDNGPDRTFSLDMLPQEYSSCGVSDFRLPSIEFEMPSGSRSADLRYTGFEVRRGKYAIQGLPAFWAADEAEADTLVLFMEDKTAQAAVELYYGVFEDCDLITRAVRVVNRGAETLRLCRCASLCLDFSHSDLDMITFNGRHLMERCPDRGPLRPGVQGVGSIRGTSSHQHNPFVVLCDPEANEDYGTAYGAVLVYSGSFEALAERNQFELSRLVMGINPYQFGWNLGPGEAFDAPEAALVCSPCGFGQMSRQFHKAIREHLIRDPYQGARRPILINNWEATTFNFNAEKLLSIAKEAAPLGLELFVMDDGWFGQRNDDNAGLGDWYVNTDKLPGGLEALVPQIQALGMKFGIWVEPEMVNEDSGLYREHPDWVLQVPGRAPCRGRGQLVLDFSRKDVRDHVYGQLRAMLSSADISYVKWDMNRSLSDVYSAALPRERQGEVFHRYVLGVYEMLEQMRSDFPGLFIEGCCGGGGRFDAGMLYYTPQIWCSDNTDAIDRLRIQYGTSFCYPPDAMGAHVSAVPNGSTGRTVPMETRGVVAMSGTFGYEMDLGETTQDEKNVIKEQVAQYKRCWELVQKGDYYRLTDPFRNPLFNAWEHVTPDRRCALVSVVTGTTYAAPAYMTLRLKGLDPALKYRVNGQDVYSGALLMSAGFPLPQPQDDYLAFQLLLEAE